MIRRTHPYPLSDLTKTTTGDTMNSRSAQIRVTKLSHHGQHHSLKKASRHRSKKKNKNLHSLDILPVNERQIIPLSLSNINPGSDNSIMVRPTLLTSTDTIKKDNRKKCQCICITYPYLCVCTLLLTVFLIGTVITAILLAVLIKPKTVTTTMATTLISSSVTFANETVYGIWNTIAGGNSNPSLNGSSVGNYYPSEEPDNILDKNISTKYTNFGSCNASSLTSAFDCGVNTGFYLTLQAGVVLLSAMRICTATSFPQRDPMTMTVEGSNQTAAALTLGSSWMLIYNGSTGLTSDPGRAAYGLTQTFSNSISYSSYRILITSVRNFTHAVQYAEVELIGY